MFAPPVPIKAVSEKPVYVVAFLRPKIRRGDNANSGRRGVLPSPNKSQVLSDI